MQDFKEALKDIEGIAEDAAIKIEELFCRLVGRPREDSLFISAPATPESKPEIADIGNLETLESIPTPPHHHNPEVGTIQPLSPTSTLQTNISNASNIIITDDLLQVGEAPILALPQEILDRMNANLINVIEVENTQNTSIENTDIPPHINIENLADNTTQDSLVVSDDGVSLDVIAHPVDNAVVVPDDSAYVGEVAPSVIPAGVDVLDENGQIA